MSLCCGSAAEKAELMGEQKDPVTSLQIPKALLDLAYNDWSVWLQTSIALTAVIYVWVLPFLQTIGWAHTCETVTVEGVVWEYPHCASWVDCMNTWSEGGASVSSYIANPQATGGMAAVEFWPCMFLYLPNRWVDSLGAYVSLLMFQIFFGLFLMNPVTRGFCTHLSVVMIFCVAGMVHMFIMGAHLNLLTPWRAAVCRICRVGAILGFLGVIFTSNVVLLTSWIGANAPFFFWFCESLGLSSWSMFVICFRYENLSQMPVWAARFRSQSENWWGDKTRQRGARLGNTFQMTGDDEWPQSHDSCIFISSHDSLSSKNHI